MSDAAEIVLTLRDAQNPGGDTLIRSVERAGDAVIVHARSTARGRASGATVEEDIALVYWVRDGRVIRGEAFRSGRDALEAAHA